jgi:2-polyprenyl-3-methyl-5-hydroxy-6-metoxy-1,4-benzoquinol methylase
MNKKLSDSKMVKNDASIDKKWFSFGKNWKKFIKKIDNRKIIEAEQSLLSLLGTGSLKGRHFLDVGSGSGIFSLAAKRLGANVHSFDSDPFSVLCAETLKKDFFSDSCTWTVENGSILDRKYLSTLKQHDIVYSWGVLHHTGNMWESLENICHLVKKNGCLIVAIYNRQKFFSIYWLFVKKTYNKLLWLRPLWIILHLIYPAVPSLIFRTLQNRKLPRGMDFWRDYIDWIGGYPFEVAKPEDIFNFFHERGFELENLRTVGGQLGCNEFVFKKK